MSVSPGRSASWLTGPTSCDSANTYVSYVTSIAGSNGLQPNGRQLRTALDRARSAAWEMSRSDAPIHDDAAKMTIYVRLFTQRLGSPAHLGRSRPGATPLGSPVPCSGGCLAAAPIVVDAHT